ncbi:4Fe-4S binding protein [Dethiobacter alkaliphilus]|uniref:4Fe-4S binding protein n=1 Tax=Dethiobacter alkaliphilus TaxID=427926 RepID=UPI002227BA49|nr:4Fe-4S binding protein [Dethiobacter alkaliphilus]MCW3489686.1 4Fe-4S binding protein [Dethiobacter alkaliphilus]
MEIAVKNEWCKGCGICVDFCPKNVLAMSEDKKACVVHSENCVACNKCELYCPDFAIHVIPQSERNWKYETVAR